jgi:hypothetical protein
MTLAGPPAPRSEARIISKMSAAIAQPVAKSDVVYKKTTKPTRSKGRKWNLVMNESKASINILCWIDKHINNCIVRWSNPIEALLMVSNKAWFDHM